MRFKQSEEPAQLPRWRSKSWGRAFRAEGRAWAKAQRCVTVLRIHSTSAISKLSEHSSHNVGPGQKREGKGHQCNWKTWASPTLWGLCKEFRSVILPTSFTSNKESMWHFNSITYLFFLSVIQQGFLAFTTCPALFWVLVVQWRVEPSPELMVRSFWWGEKGKKQTTTSTTTNHVRWPYMSHVQR